MYYIVMMNKIKHDNFLRISERRKERILSMIEQLSNLNNSSFYEFEEKEVVALFNAIDEKSKEVKNKILKSSKERIKKEVL